LLNLPRFRRQLSPLAEKHNKLYEPKIIC